MNKIDEELVCLRFGQSFFSMGNSIEKISLCVCVDVNEFVFLILFF